MNKAIYTCQLCSKKSKSANSIPFVRMGGVAFQKIVCDDCFKKRSEHMSKFWRKAKDEKDPYNCCHCSGDLEMFGKCHAQRDKLGDGVLTHEIICSDCFDDFLEHCNSGECGEHKEKGE